MWHARRYSNWTARLGAVAPLVAVSLVGLMGVLAFALEGGLTMDNRRRVQSAADAAALAAATDLFKKYQTAGTSGGTDPTGSAAQSAQTTAAANGFTHGVDGTTVTVRTAGQDALQPSPEKLWSNNLNKVKTGYVEVEISYNQQRSFSALFGSGAIVVKARAVAEGSAKPQTRPGIIVLEPEAEFPLKVSGNGTITVPNAAVTVNTTHPNAFQHSGNGPVSAKEWNFVNPPGYVSSGSGTITGTVNTGVPPTPDPLRNLPVPDPNTLPLISNNPTTHGSDEPITLQPGVYRGGITLSGNGNITMNPGTYYIQGGGFQISGTSNLTANGVFLYNADGGTGPPAGQIQVSGNGIINWTPPTTGTYAGVSIFQERTVPKQLNLSGNGNTNIQGTVYAANAELQVSGNGVLGVSDSFGSQFVTRYLKSSGNGDISISIDPGAPNPPAKVLRLVE